MTAETDPPRESGFSPRQVRMLKASVIIMSALIVLCIFALMAGIYYQSNKLGKTSSDKSGLADRNGGVSTGSGLAAVRGAPVTLKVRPGAVVESQTTEGGVLILRLKSPDGTEIAILDLKSGEEIRRIVLKAE
jgi:hypothetical protein